MKRLLQPILLLGLAAALVACSRAAPSAAPPTLAASAPSRVVPVATLALPSVTAQPSATAQPIAWPIPDWSSSSPEAQGMDSRQLAEMLDFIKAQQLDLHSLLVVRHGFIVLETYFYPYQANTQHAIYSATKSVTSALVGVAIADGAIPGVQTPLVDLFPGRTIANLDQRKRSITLEHMLTMSSGLEWRRPASGGPSPVFAFQRSNDPTQFVLDQPVADEPGSVFFYNSGGSFLLSAVVQQRTGTTSLDYARKHIFEPIGAGPIEWRAPMAGIYDGGTGIWMLPRDMARFGLLHLRRGMWADRQLIPAEWVDAATRSHIVTPSEAGHGYDPTPDVAGYGYQWWINSFSGATALGFGGQHIFVLPEQDLVVVVTSTTPDVGGITPAELTRRFVLPAVRSSEALPADQATTEQLTKLIASAIAKPMPQTIAPLPELARQISGKTYEVQSAEGRDVERFSLTFEPASDVAHFEGMFDGQMIEATVGLDGIDRITPTAAGQVLLNGRWQDDHTFVMDADLLGEAIREEATFTFEGQRVTAAYRSHVYGNVFTLEGAQVR